MSQHLCYEFPIAKSMRLFLRIEQLMKQFDEHAQNDDPTATLDALTILRDIYQFTLHVDLKAEVLRESDRILSKDQTSDDQIIREKAEQLSEECRVIISDIHGQLGTHLKNHYLFNLIRQRLTMPGGINPFDLPVSHYWLNQPHEERQKVLVRWIMPYFQINKAVHKILLYVRNIASVESQIAEKGFFQDTINPANDHQILQILVPSSNTSFPEISLGRQRITMRFFDLQDPAERPSQTKNDIQFDIKYCG